MSGPYTAQQKLNAIARELALRAATYPKRIDAGKMSSSEAAYQLGIMEAIAEDYRMEVNQMKLPLE